MLICLSFLFFLMSVILMIVNVMNVLNVKVDSYLWMLFDVGNNKNGVLMFLKDGVWNKVKGWMVKILLIGGKEVLINLLFSLCWFILCFVLNFFVDYVNILIFWYMNFGVVVSSVSGSLVGFYGVWWRD